MKNNEAVFSDVSASVYKAFPGVQGEVHHFVNYELSFSLSSACDIAVRSLEADGKMIPVKQLMVGRELLATANTIIAGPVENIKIEAGYPVYLGEADQENVNGQLKNPAKLFLVFERNGKTRKFEIEQIIQKNPVFYPAANPGPSNQR